MAIDALASGWAKAVGLDRKQFDMFFNKMLDGFAYHRIVVNESGKPVDYVFLEVNQAFEKMTGLKRELILGKKVTDVLPGIENDPADWMGIYGNVALKGEPVQFENYNEALGKWFKVSSYCPDKGYFVVLFEDITEPKKAKEELTRAAELARQRAEELEKLMDIIPAAVWVSRDPQCENITGNQFANSFYEVGWGENVSAGPAKGGLQDNTRRFFKDGKALAANELPMQEAVAKNIEIRNSELDVLLPSDRKITILGNAKPLLDSIGNVRGCLAVFMDISERKKVEETLAFNSSLAENLSEAVISTDLDFKIRTWNRAAEAIYGFKEAEVIGKTTSEVLKTVIPDDSVKQAASRLMENSFWRGEAVQLKKDGSPVNILSSVSLIRDKAGEPVAIVAVNRDITRRKRNEEALRNQAALIDLSPDGILVRKTDGTITFWSKGAENLYGWTKDEAIGQCTHSLLKTRFPESFESILDQMKANGRWSGELVHTTKTGREVVVQSWWMGRLDSNGEMVELLESNVDVTHLMQMQYKLEDYASNLEKLVEERTKQLKDSERLATIGATAGMVGHDIRNPLQAIIGDIYLLKEYLPMMPESSAKKDVTESLESIENNIYYINKIVADLQDFARPLKPNLEETDLKFILDDLLKKNDLPGNVEVSVKVEDAARYIVADSAFINRIMYNLVNNAVQAMATGGKLTIHVLKKGKGVQISVEDTGVGIPEAVKGKLFTPMFTTKSKGQGFGLAVIKRMTEALGGVVSFESQEGVGTTFMVELPQRSFRKKMV